MFFIKLQRINQFIRGHYSDNSLVKLARAAERGEVHFVSPTACLLGRSDYPGRTMESSDHPAAKALLDWEMTIGVYLTNRLILAPLANREMARRVRASAAQASLNAEGRQLTEELLKASLGISYESEHEQTVVGQSGAERG